MTNIKTFEYSDVQDVKNFTDKLLGKETYSLDQLEQIVELSKAGEYNSSFLAYSDDSGELIGVRFTYAPSMEWQTLSHLTPSLWSVPRSKVSYFINMYIADQYKNHDLEKLLTKKCEDVIKKLGGKAIICHSNLDKPHHEKRKFQQIKSWPNFWNELNSSCPQCGRPCFCSASEMIKYI